MRIRAAWIAVLMGLLPAAAAAGPDEDMARAAIAAVCGRPAEAGPKPGSALDGARVLREAPMLRNGRPIGAARDYALADGGVVKIVHGFGAGARRRITADYYAPSPRGPKASVSVAADAQSCAVLEGRRIVYEDGNARRLEALGPDLRPKGEPIPINPPMPAGTAKPGGVSVAVIDSGVNYLLPEIAAALARDERGRPLGFDYWELDALPFDVDPAESPFAPRRHGTMVAGALLREAGDLVRLVPYRQPGRHPERMRDLVEDMARKGVRIANLSWGNPEPERWQVFAAAAKAHPEILFVAAAGNRGQDLEARPDYPASLDLPNMIVVGNLAEDGALAASSNWGRKVHVAVRGEGVDTIAFDGRAVKAGGTSFAAPRVAALAARLLAANSGWTTEQLKQAILSRAKPLAGPRGTAFGAISDLR